MQAREFLNYRLSLIGHSLKIWTPLRKLFAPTGVPSWLQAWAKLSDELAFLTYNRDVTVDHEMLVDELFKKKRKYFVKSKFGYRHPLICSYESTYILLVVFELFNRHNQ